METTIIILLTLAIMISLLSMLYITLYNKIQFSKIRVEKANNEILDLLKERYNLVMQCKETIENNTKKELTLFSNLEKANKTNINSYKLEKKITESITTIYLIKNDYPKLEEKKDFKEILRKLQESDTKIDAAKSYYNKNNKVLINYIKSFPSNIICIFNRIKINPYYDAKEIFNEKDDGIKI